MDVLSFDAFARSLRRVQAADMHEQAWTNYVTTQCTQESVQKFTKDRFLKELGEQVAQKTGLDLARDLRIKVE